MKNTGKIIRYAYYGIIALLVVIGFVKIFGHTTEEIEADNSIVNLLMNQGVAYAYIAAGLVLVLAIIGLITHFKQSIWTLVGIGVLVAVFFIAVSMSSSGGPEFLESFGHDAGITAGESKYSEAGLRTMFILGGMAIVGAIASGVKGLFE